MVDRIIPEHKEESIAARHARIYKKTTGSPISGDLLLETAGRKNVFSALEAGELVTPDKSTNQSIHYPLVSTKKTGKQSK